MIFNNQVSSDHARKSIKLIRDLAEIERTTKLIKQTEQEDTDIEINKKTSIEINQDGSQKSQRIIQMNENQSKDSYFLLTAHGYNPNEWQITSARNSIWNSYNKKDGVIELYSSGITVKPIAEFVWDEEKARKVFEGLKRKPFEQIIVNDLVSKDDGDILIIPIADLHYGLYADEYSTGNVYNSEIAKEYFHYTLDDIINRTKNKSLQKILFVVGNDLVNFDNLAGTTTRGTPQNNSESWYELVVNATQLLVDGIDKLYSNLKVPVEVLYVPSNHDMQTTFGIVQTVKAHFNKHDHIKVVDDTPMTRKYYRVGKTLFVFAHDIAIKRALEAISVESKGDWGTCDRVICLLAHKHQQMVYQKQGKLEMMRLPTISGWSRWTNTMGYVQNEKKNKSFIVNEELGILDEINTIIM